MKNYVDKISMQTNSRGCDIIDTVKGCSVCKIKKPLGCYDNCYAKNIADRYGMDFSSPVNRNFHFDKSQIMLFDFYSSVHINEVIRSIKKSPMPFVRIGEMGDPSEDWEHTINVCQVIAIAGKPIVIITKHWNTIDDKLLESIKLMNIVINTSISALDSTEEIEHRLHQYKRLKNYCKSVLRVVTCDFNKSNNEGVIKNNIQESLLEYNDVINTVFRPSKTNKLVIDGVINVKKVKFLKSTMLASVFDEKTYLGNCNKCPDMCGIY